MSPMRRSPIPAKASTTTKEHVDLELAKTQSIDSIESPPHIPGNMATTPHSARSSMHSLDINEVTSRSPDDKKETLTRTSRTGTIVQVPLCELDLLSSPTLVQRMMAEATGTALLVHFGCGAVCASLYTEALIGLGQATTIWTLGAALALYCSASTSGGHLNPAVTLSFAVVRRHEFSCKLVVPYWISQLAGAMVAAFINYALFFEAIATYEETHGITRGTDSINSARGFGVYPSNVNSTFHAFFCEAFGAGLLTFIIFCVTHPKNSVPGAAVPAIVGAAIGSIIAILGSICGGGINPARDLGPRLVTAILGWKLDSFALASSSLFGPFVGGPIGAMLADNLFLRHESAKNHVKL